MVNLIQFRIIGLVPGGAVAGEGWGVIVSNKATLDSWDDPEGNC